VDAKKVKNKAKDVTKAFIVIVMVTPAICSITKNRIKLFLLITPGS
jgi:hypothetical protein